MPRPVRLGAHELFLLGVLACTAVALWLVWPAFSPGRIVNLDAPRHLLRSMVMAKQLLPSGHVDGWSPWWYLGAQLFLFQSYGCFFLIGAAAFVLERFVDIGTVFKVFYVLPVVALPATLAFVARRLGVSRAGALGAAAASIVFSSPFGYGMQGLFGIGLLLQCAGIVAFALAWPSVLDALLDEDSLAPAVLLLAGALLLHFITGAYALAVTGLVAAGAAATRRELRPLMRYAGLTVLVLLLAGHTLFPSLEWREIAGSGVGWGQNRDRLHSFFAGKLFGARVWAFASIVAAVLCVVQRRGRLAITAAVFLGTAVIAGINIQPWEPKWLTKLLGVFVRPRMLPYAALFQALFFGVAIEALWSARSRLERRAGWATSVRGATLVLLVGLGIIGGDKLVHYRSWVRTESMIVRAHRDPYKQLTAWLRSNVRRPGVIALPRSMFSLRGIGAYSLISLVNMDTKLYTLGGDQAELTKSGRTRPINMKRPPERLARTLRSLGVAVLVVTEDDVRHYLQGTEDFEPAYEYPSPDKRPLARGRVTVYRVRNGGARLMVNGAAAEQPSASPERLSWVVELQGRSERNVLAAVSWHPNWTAWVDERQVPITRTRLWTMQFPVPPGAHRVSLRFHRNARERIYNAVSAGTLLIVVGMWLRSRRRRRGVPRPAALD